MFIFSVQNYQTFMKRLLTRTAEYTELDENLFLCRLFDGVEIDAKDSQENYEAIVELSEGKPYAVLVDARVTVTITREALAHSTRREHSEKLIANAIVINSLANRLICNFKIRMQKNNGATKLFNEYDKALEWLHEVLRKEHKGQRAFLI